VAVAGANSYKKQIKRLFFEPFRKISPASLEKIITICSDMSISKSRYGIQTASMEQFPEIQQKLYIDKNCILLLIIIVHLHSRLPDARRPETRILCRK
jgi:hypothetical protein